MLEFEISPSQMIRVADKTINCFDNQSINIDRATVQSFGEEWSKFNSFSTEEINQIGDDYFDIVTQNEIINKNSIILDVGCGTGRWSMYFADKVRWIEAIDPSDAVFAAAALTNKKSNVRISKTASDKIPFKDNSFDMVMSVGVLHHIPDTGLALKHISQKAKIGGYVYIYIYYALDNRGILFRSIFKLSNIVRRAISSMPSRLKKLTCEIIAYIVYLPFIGFAALVKNIFRGKDYWTKIPLNYYLGKPLNIIRNDALDRFGTPLEQRFTKLQIITMMHSAGLDDIIVSERQPFWHAVGKRVR